MIMPAGMNTFLDSVPTGEAYDYELAAFDSTWMEYSEWIATDSSATAWDNIAPEQIADFEATLENLDEGWRIVLHWTPSSSSDLLTQTIYRSVNGGDWNGLATLQPTATTFQDTITEIGSYFYQVRSTDGWNITVSDSVGVEVAGSDVFVGLPQTLMLTGVSPNPAKSTLTVHFGIPSAGNVEFILHDLHGRRVAETTIPCQRSGWFDIPVDLSSLSGRELTSGTFMVQLSYGSQRSTTPLVIVR